ncbi:hypothetical protein J5A56_02490 [Prevotella melaninogenica]|uniref:hypothetical protein n=1 Tax=Prevotella TaxID=838 RepID=UPI0003AD19CE|nr:MULTISPECIES: hypothetical protein [Prevotella]ERJ74971.1 hypothetical protein HMPREF9148_02172 [Prevotella sp. F0091]QUB73263.1 hypothetical protein J5A56_02490 [Prevotella melaninogenica]
MKKSFLTFVLLLAVTALNAQTLIKANFQKGDQATYESVADIKLSVPMAGNSESIKTNSKTKIIVKDATADGYVIEMTTTNMKMEGNQEVVQQTGNMLNQYLSNVPMLLKTDANGKVKDLLNYTEVQTKVSKFAMAFIDSLYKAKPEMEKTLPKYKMAMSTNSLLTKESFIESAENNSFFILFGKTLKTGDKEDMNKQGIKTSVTYEVNKEPNALNIIGKIKGNMTEDDVKAFFIDKMKQMGADEAMVSKLDANWGQLQKMGMAKMDLDGTSTTKLLNTGWATEYSTDVKTKMMGMEMTINTVTKLVEKSWK